MNYLHDEPTSSSFFFVQVPHSSFLFIEIAHHLLTEVSPQRFFSKNAVIVQSVILALNSRACSTLMGRS